MIAWAYAHALAEDQRRAVDQRWRRAVDDQLAAAGIFARVAEANTAIVSEAFAAALNASEEARRAAKDENDLRVICVDILRGLGVDMTDLTVRLRRSLDADLPRWLRRQGGAQLHLAAGPTVEAAQRALDAAAAAGYPVPGTAAAAALAEQTSQGTSVG